MKHYFLVAKDVGDLTRILCAVLGGGAQEEPARCAASSPSRACRSRGKIPLVDGFQSSTATASTSTGEKDAFERDPVKLIRLFREAQRHRSGHPPDALRLVPPVACNADRQEPAQPTPRPTGCSWKCCATTTTPERTLTPPERGRRLRPVHPRFRPRRRPDAVRHVPCLHGRRAHHPGHRHPARHRERRAVRRTIRSPVRGDRRAAVAPRPLCRRCCCTTSPRAAAAIIRKIARRPHRPSPVPALRPRRLGDRDRRPG